MNRLIVAWIRVTLSLALILILLYEASPMPHLAQDFASETPVETILPVETAVSPTPSITENSATPELPVETPTLFATDALVLSATPGETAFLISPSATTAPGGEITITPDEPGMTATPALPTLLPCTAVADSGTAVAGTTLVPADCSLATVTPEATVAAAGEVLPASLTPAATPAASATVAATLVESGTLSGRVLRPYGHAAGIEVVVINASNIAGVITTGADGSFLFSGLLPDTYQVLAFSDGYLPVATSVVLASGSRVLLPPATLLPGDINHDNHIDTADVDILAHFYGSPIPPAPAEADLNHDGKINLVDFEIIARSFGKTGPVNW